MRLRGIIAVAVLVLTLLFTEGCAKVQERIQRPERTVKNNVYLEGLNVGGLKEAEALEKLKSLAGKVDIEPIDSKISGTDWEVTEHREGSKVNLKKTLEELLNSPEGGSVRLNVETVKPGITSDKLKENIVEIGSYTTPLLDRQESRVRNINIASGCMDYTIVAPGEEFSFNNTLGKRTQAKGYKEAPIIVKTPGGHKRGYGLGGGICQISTTLYNAVAKAGLEVTERHSHSKDIGYAPRGQDATVSYGSVDFRFRNNRGYPIMIRIYPGERELTISILENRN